MLEEPQNMAPTRPWLMMGSIGMAGRAVPAKKVVFFQSKEVDAKAEKAKSEAGERSPEQGGRSPKQSGWEPKHRGQSLKQGGRSLKQGGRSPKHGGQSPKHGGWSPKHGGWSPEQGRHKPRCSPCLNSSLLSQLHLPWAPGGPWLQGSPSCPLATSVTHCLNQKGKTGMLLADGGMPTCPCRMLEGVGHLALPTM